MPLSSPSPWPGGAKACVSFTMDNLGEAQAVRTGSHPASQPIGHDPAVLTHLPRMLDLLDGAGAGAGAGASGGIRRRGRGVKATYFAESWSLPVYPSAVADLKARGHEVAWHGYQHEVWRSLSAAEEEDNFARSAKLARREYAGAGAGAGVPGAGAGAGVPGDAGALVYEGFRPPGGEINGARTLDLLRQYGIKYVSPLGRFGIDTASGIVVLPFEWETVDAFWYMDKFAGIRKDHGVQEAPALGPEEFKRYLYDKFEMIKEEGGYISILFHPFLQTSEEKFKALEEVIQRISTDQDLWVAPCNEVARWVTEHADEFNFQA